MNKKWVSCNFEVACLYGFNASNVLMIDIFFSNIENWYNNSIYSARRKENLWRNV